MVRVAVGSEMRTKRTCERRSDGHRGYQRNAYAGHRPDRASWRIARSSKTTWGENARARSQAAMAFSAEAVPIAQ